MLQYRIRMDLLSMLLYAALSIKEENKTKEYTRRPEKN